jgi:hypothetical protein
MAPYLKGEQPVDSHSLYCYCFFGISSLMYSEKEFGNIKRNLLGISVIFIIDLSRNWLRWRKSQNFYRYLSIQIRFSQDTRH